MKRAVPVTSRHPAKTATVASPRSSGPLRGRESAMVPTSSTEATRENTADQIAELSPVRLMQMKSGKADSGQGGDENAPSLA